MRLTYSLVSTILALALVQTADARPMGPSKGRSLMPLEDVADIARLADGLDAVACPMAGRLGAKTGKRLQPSALQGGRRQGGKGQRKPVVAKSWDAEPGAAEEELISLNWAVTSDPSSGSITLAISSLPLIDDTLDLLSQEYPGQDLPLADFPSLSPESGVQVHPGIMLYFEQEGRQAIDAVRKLVQPPTTPASLLPAPLQRLLGLPPRIHFVRITGHGMGGAVAQLVAMALLDLDVEIDVTAFASPRVGNPEFAGWLDASPAVIRRVNSFADPMPHIPDARDGYKHAGAEIWIGANPKLVFKCEPGYKRKACFEEIDIKQTSVGDHAGPFAGVWIGRGCPAV